jgi:hypothetical protein
LNAARPTQIGTCRKTSTGWLFDWNFSKRICPDIYEIIGLIGLLFFGGLSGFRVRRGHLFFLSFAGFAINHFNKVLLVNKLTLFLHVSAPSGEKYG